jgi:N-methylhydantoinase A
MSEPRQPLSNPHPDRPTIVAVDTGGTFTDILCLRPDGSLARLKLASTPHDPAEAVIEGIRRVLADPGGDHPTVEGPGEVPRPRPRPGRGPILLIHGSTVATNALLERRGARVGLVTNRGLEDVVEIGRQNRPQLYALVGRRLPPLVAREDRHGVAGRLGPRGEEVEPLDEAELAALPERLRGVASVAVCLLHSYANPALELRVAAALAGLGVPVSVSSEILPEYREYERTATTVANAYVAPLMDRYLGQLEREAGATRVRIMGSAGGALPLARARREPVHTILSGPAGGVMGALEAARRAGFSDVIGFDMGGTSTDVTLCPGRPLHTREFVIAGLPVAVPVLDIHTVGAGGGSIARVDAGGALRVGPESAGADPGPICYGRGGSEVTVTDAHVWLGRLPADAFLGGERRLERERIAEPLAALGERLGCSPDEAAEGVLAVVGAAMEGALRVISVERGYDPADFTLVPFGGAGGLHAAELAERLGIPRILLPPDPGLLSAFGMLVSPLRKDASRTVLLEAGAAAGRLEEEFARLAADAVAAMEAEGIPRARVTLTFWVDARYRGQSYELRVPAEDWVEAFHAAHEARYGYARRGAVVEAVTLRVEATAPGPAVPEPRLPAAPSPDPRPDAIETVVLQGNGVHVPRYGRPRLLAGHRIVGPAIITEYSATAWLPPGWRAEVLPGGAILMER